MSVSAPRVLWAMLFSIATQAQTLRYWEFYSDPTSGLTFIAMPFDTTAWAALNPAVPALRGLTISVRVTDAARNFIVRVDYRDARGRPQQQFGIARIYGAPDWAGVNVVVPPESVTAIRVVGFQATTPEVEAAVEPAAPAVRGG